jgi:pyridoxamine 5'-phosphate oxidase
MTEMEAVMGRDPIAVFRAWLKEAEATEPNDPNAVALATASR